MTLKLYNKGWIRNPGDKCQDQGYCFCNYTCNKKLLHGTGSPPPLPLQKKKTEWKIHFRGGAAYRILEFFILQFWKYKEKKERRTHPRPPPGCITKSTNIWATKVKDTDLSIKAIMQKKRKENNWVTHISFLRHRDWVVFWWCHFDFFSINFDST